MDPISMFGLIASALSVAEITTRVGMGCRNLQTQFSGALEHIDNISQQTSTIDLAIREICDIFHQRPQTFPSSFESHLGDSVSAVHNIVRQIQDHVQSVRAEAERSYSRAKLRHLCKSAQVTEWGATLVVQTQALMLLLQVAQLHSNDERATVLEKASSRDVFEKASSMSAKLAKSSSELDRKNEFVKFPFDSVLLETKVYRRVCESSWIREVSTALEDGNESDGSGPASIVSVSSNSAIASEGDCASSSRDLGVSGQEPGHARDPTIPVFSDCIYPRPGMPMLELSSTNSSEQTGEFSSTSPTKSTLATTSSSIDGVGVGRDIEDTGKDNTVETPSTHVVSVVVEEVGTDSTELALHETPDHYDKTQETIRHIRDRVLLAGGVDPGTYSGACVSSTIETTGRSEVHRFPLTPEFLTYAVNKVRDGFYDSFEILARFSSPNQSSGIGLRYPCNTPTGMEPAIMPIREGEAASLVQMALSTRGEPHHLDIPSHASLPFIESLRPEHRAKGGFSDVWRVAIHPAYLDESPARQGETQYFAVKRFRRDASATAMFHREVTVLKAISGPAQHPHITQLLGTFHWRGSDHLLLPWAEGNLQDFWRSRPGPAGTLQPEERRLFVSEVLEQLLGLADALKHLHLRLNSHSNARAEDVEQGITHGRHGDIKPQNILWFREPSASQRVDRLKLADLGLASFHNSEVDPAYPETRGGTETYGAPELKHHSPGQRLTSAYDVWSLGCVFIEAAIWVCMGPKGVDAFKRSRYEQTRHGTFFEAQGGHIGISPPVSRQLQACRRSITRLEQPLSDGLALFLDAIEPCLEVDAAKRPSAAAVASKMRAAYTAISGHQDSGTLCTCVWTCCYCGRDYRDRGTWDCCGHGTSCCCCGHCAQARCGNCSQDRCAVGE